MKRIDEKTRQEYIRDLRKTLKPGTRVYTVLRSASRSGMSRRIDLYTVRKGQLAFLTGSVAYALNEPGYFGSKGRGLRVNGCGMDMGFHIVYSLSRVLYPKGYKLPRGKIGRNGDTSGFDSDGGYALEHACI